ncbi:MAG: thiamine-phosphate kinase [Bdellovibrionales bacterium]|nr:thiamine-phosphate kinase [Bdellovibrionales bacterium]
MTSLLSFVTIPPMTTEAEFLKLIQKISRKTGYRLIGDDAAIVPTPPIKNLVMTTDQFIEGTHFTWDQMSSAEIGCKAVVQALSDIAAMAATPISLMASAAWPRSQDQKIKGALKGIEKACREYQVPLVGGDISRSPSTYFDFCVIGASSQPALKSGVQPGDLIVMTGPTGLAAAGYLCIQKHWNSPSLIRKFKKPTAQIQIAKILAQKNYLTSATDISDSLSFSLGELAKHSKCNLIIEKQKLPYSPALKKFCRDKKLSMDEFIFHGGEDYHLLATVHPKTPRKFLLDHGLHAVGYATMAHSKPKIFVQIEKQIEELIVRGWDPFTLNKG